MSESGLCYRSTPARRAAIERVDVDRNLDAGLRELVLAELGTRTIAEALKRAELPRRQRYAACEGLGEGDWQQLTELLVPDLVEAALTGQQLVSEDAAMTGVEAPPLRTRTIPDWFRGSQRLDWLRWLTNEATTTGRTAPEIVTAPTYDPYHFSSELHVREGYLLAALLDLGDPEAERIVADAKQPDLQILFGLLRSVGQGSEARLEHALRRHPLRRDFTEYGLDRLSALCPRTQIRLLDDALDVDGTTHALSAATKRATFGFPSDVILDPQVVERMLRTLRNGLGDPERARHEAMAPTTDFPERYAALWAVGQADAEQLLTTSTTLLGCEDSDTRLTTVHVLLATRLPEARQLLIPSLDDPDLPVACLALDGFRAPTKRRKEPDPTPRFDPEELFEACLRLLPRLRGNRTPLASPFVPPDVPWRCGATEVAEALLSHFRSPRLAEAFPRPGNLPIWIREDLALALVGIASGSRHRSPAPVRAAEGLARRLLSRLLDDRHASVRAAASHALLSNPGGDHERTPCE